MRTIDWDDDRECIVMVDQTKLPEEYTRYHVETVDDLVDSIQKLRVRGAPALGAAGAFGVALSAHNHYEVNFNVYRTEIAQDAGRIAEARPTAVNLSRSVETVMDLVHRSENISEARSKTLQKARELADEDVGVNKRIGEHGAELLESGQTVMTHCNAGALATVDWGTALGVVYSPVEQGKQVSVIANETRPLNQGSRITTVELLEHNVETTLIPDNASGLCLQEHKVDAVVVGADRVVLDGGEEYGDQGVVFNKIGTYKHAVLADRHGIPFIVAVPESTIDLEHSADEVEIEQRDPDELKQIYGQSNAPEDVDVYNPAFDATPMELVDYIVTENGVFEPPLKQEDFK